MIEEPRKIRILIADMHPAICEGLNALISRQEDMVVVGEAENGPEAIKQFSRVMPDIGIVGLMMSGTDGINVISTICKQHSSARIVILADHSGDVYIQRALRVGAKAYLLKNGSNEDLIGCIKRVHCGETWLPDTIASKLMAHLMYPSLSDRELDVLQLVAAGNRNKEIGEALRITEGTVKAHISNLLRKLSVTGRGEAILEACKRGFLQI